MNGDLKVENQAFTTEYMSYFLKLYKAIFKVP